MGAMGSKPGYRICSLLSLDSVHTFYIATPKEIMSPVFGRLLRNLQVRQVRGKSKSHVEASFGYENS